MDKMKVAFICVHNSCRSQIAEALGKYLASDVFESYSAGTETKPQINQDAVRLMKEIYQIDMEETQYSKLLSVVPLFFTCNVSEGAVSPCSPLPCTRIRFWCSSILIPIFRKQSIVARQSAPLRKLWISVIPLARDANITLR